MDRLTKLENENALFKSQIRALKKPSKEKPQIINNIVKSNGFTKQDILEIVCGKITLDYINRLYGK